MKRIILGFVVASFLVPPFALAQESSVTRREGFLLMWNSIRRAVLENREKYFEDVPADAKGSEEITYAKYRGLLDDDDPRFYPDVPLSQADALLWLFRTRSVDDIDELTTENLPALLERYPIADGVLSAPITQEDLLFLMRKLDELLMTEDHEVSLYSEKFHGKGTAFGESFDMHALTAAHRTFPHNTLVKVTNISNGKSVTVRINDRGPYVEGRDMDLSLASFLTIEDRSKGILRARFQRLGDATLVSRCDDSDPRRAVRISRTVRLTRGIPASFPLGHNLYLQSTKPIVVHAIRYPDGHTVYPYDWVLPEETHHFSPSVEGEYTFWIGSGNGRYRELRMNVVACGE